MGWGAQFARLAWPDTRRRREIAAGSQTVRAVYKGKAAYRQSRAATRLSSPPYNRQQMTCISDWLSHQMGHLPFLWSYLLLYKSDELFGIIANGNQTSKRKCYSWKLYRLFPYASLSLTAILTD